MANVQIQLTIPKELADIVTKLAKDNLRSVSNQVAIIIKEWVEEKEGER